MVTDLLPLWIYCAGIPLAWIVAAYGVGLDAPSEFEKAHAEWKEKSSNHGRYYDKEEPHLENWILGYSILYFFGSGLWPVVAASTLIYLPLNKVYNLGKKKTYSKRQLQKQLDEANKEIEQIKQQEGWVS